MNLHKHVYQWMSGIAAGAGAAAGWKVNLQVKVMWTIKFSGISRAIQWFYSKIISMILKFGGGVSGAAKVIKCKFSKSLFLSSSAQKKHFGHHGNSKSGQGHQRSSSANFENVYFWAPMHRKSNLVIMGGQNQVEVTKGHQV